MRDSLSEEIHMAYRHIPYYICKHTSCPLSLMRFFPSAAVVAQPSSTVGSLLYVRPLTTSYHFTFLFLGKELPCVSRRESSDNMFYYNNSYKECELFKKTAFPLGFSAFQLPSILLALQIYDYYLEYLLLINV